MSNQTNLIRNTEDSIQLNPTDITPIIKGENKSDSGKFKSSLSENNIKKHKGLKQKLVNKVKSWNSRDKCYDREGVPTDVETNLLDDFQKLSLISETTEECGGNFNLTRARDSLENLSVEQKVSPRPATSPRLNTSPPMSLEKNPPESPKSSPALREVVKPSTSVSKKFIWDPFDKQNNRKNRKEYKRKKVNKKMDSSKAEAFPMLGESNNFMGCKMGDEEYKPKNATNNSYVADEESPYTRYKYSPKNTKSVLFTNEVMVVYFNGDEIICESEEPLKKEIEQQVRNKEMRRGHLIKTQEKYNLCLF